MFQFFKRTLKKIIKNKQQSEHAAVSVYSSSKDIKGWVLFSYMNQPFLWAEDDVRFLWHSNLWESREIVRIFNELGFNVDVIDWANSCFYPQKNYCIIFDIASNLQRIAPFLSLGTLKILHITGSFPAYQRLAELKRVEQLELRKKMLYSPKRIFTHIDLFERSLKLADKASLIGSEFTLSTFPEEYRKKITLVPVSASKLPFIKNETNYVPVERDFLFFSGFGAVHKGLDLVLDVFSRNENLRLHVVGNISSERDFMNIYKNELMHSKNVFYYGALSPSSEKFMAIVQRCVSFISPSCSEGMSSAAAVCLQIGLYPIVSKENGCILPSGKGIVLQECSIDEIEVAVRNVFYMKKDLLTDHVKACQSYALYELSRENFRIKTKHFLEKTINEHFQRSMSNVHLK